MTAPPSFSAADRTLLTDLYQLTMMQAYWREEMREDAVFTLFVRRLPEHRNYLLACGLAEALDFLESAQFDDDAIAYLSTLRLFRDEFLDWLRTFRFTGDVYAVPEGTPVFANEPMLEVVGPIAEAQLAETFLMNQIHYQTLAASKASRVVTAAEGRAVVDFGLRRIHGADAGLRSARAFHIAGVAATSNVLAGRIYDLRVSGTMAHSYVQSHDREIDAFRAFIETYPEATLLVDTYDTLDGVRKVIQLARERGSDFRVRAVRLDSGDLGQLAFESRRLLDAAGLHAVEIFASGGLDEYKVGELVASGAPIDGFGVGTGMGVSQDHPSLDIVYKLAEYGGRGRLKTSPDKPILPGRKQVFRIMEGGAATRDLIGRWDERIEHGRPLLRQVMSSGKALETVREPLQAARDRAREEIDALPAKVRSISPADPPYPVEATGSLRAYQEEITAAVAM